MPVIIRSSRHPDDARCQVRILRAGAVDSVALIEFEGARGEGAVVRRVDSCPLSPTEARRLFSTARLDSLAGTEAQIRQFKPGPAKVSAARGPVKQLTSVQLTPDGMDALEFIVQWMQTHKVDFAGRHGACDLALQEAARSRGWNPRAAAPQREPTRDGTR